VPSALFTSILAIAGRLLTILYTGSIYIIVSNKEPSMDLVHALPRYDLPRAGRALAALLRNPDDLPQVFTIIDSLSGTAPHRLLRKFKQTETGRRLLRDKPDITPLLADRAALRAMPAGSLGRAYLAFVESENISAEGIRAASSESEYARPEEFRYLHDRLRDTHDLWHAATGYKGDVLGELALLAFILAQNWNTAIAMIVAAGVIKGFSHGASGVDVIRDGWRRGKSAAWLGSQDWEALLPLPLDEVRLRLGLESPPNYVPVRSSELRAEGVI
jgi:ubiquinone biosynthesis protein COQ4